MFNVTNDVRIEIMQALLHDSVVSKEAFSEIAKLFESVEGQDDTAWEAYKAQFEASEEE